MKPQIISKGSATGASAAVPVDFKRNPFSVGMGAVVSGTLTYQIQHTFDDLFDTSVTPTWFTHATMTALTGNQDGNYAFPIRGIRINVTAWTSGTVTLTILQGGRD